MKDMITRQWILIGRMEQALGIKFEGYTFEEAKTFIAENLDRYKEEGIDLVFEEER